MKTFAFTKDEVVLLRDVLSKEIAYVTMVLEKNHDVVMNRRKIELDWLIVKFIERRF